MINDGCNRGQERSINIKSRYGLLNAPRLLACFSRSHDHVSVKTFLLERAQKVDARSRLKEKEGRREAIIIILASTSTPAPNLKSYLLHKLQSFPSA